MHERVALEPRLLVPVLARVIDAFKHRQRRLKQYFTDIPRTATH